MPRQQNMEQHAFKVIIICSPSNTPQPLSVLLGLLLVCRASPLTAPCTPNNKVVICKVEPAPHHVASCLEKRHLGLDTSCRWFQFVSPRLSQSDLHYSVVTNHIIPCLFHILSWFYLHWSPRAAVTSLQKCGALRQQKFILSQFWKPKVQNRGVRKATLLLIV